VKYSLVVVTPIVNDDLAIDVKWPIFYNSPFTIDHSQIEISFYPKHSTSQSKNAPTVG